MESYVHINLFVYTLYILISRIMWYRASYNTYNIWDHTIYSILFLPSFTLHNVFQVSVKAFIKISLLSLQIVLHHMKIPHLVYLFVHQFMEIWIVSISCLLRIIKPWTFMHKSYIWPLLIDIFPQSFLSLSHQLKGTDSRIWWHGFEHLSPALFRCVIGKMKLLSELWFFHL